MSPKGLKIVSNSELCADSENPFLKCFFPIFLRFFLYENGEIAILTGDIVYIYLNKHMWCQIKLFDAWDPMIRQINIF